jgi:hypothetical protein
MAVFWPDCRGFLCVPARGSDFLCHDFAFARRALCWVEEENERKAGDLELARKADQAERVQWGYESGIDPVSGDGVGDQYGCADAGVPLRGV